MSTDDETLALQALDRATLLAERYGVAKRIDNTNSLRLIVPAEIAHVELTIDPLPWALHLIRSNQTAGAESDYSYIGFGIYEMLRRLRGQLATLVPSAALSTQFDLGPMIRIDTIPEDTRLDSSILASAPKERVRPLFEDSEEWISVILNGDGGKGNKPNIGPNGAERACVAVDNTIPYFKEAKKRYRLLKKEWQRGLLGRRRSVKPGDWERHWTKTLGPQTYPNLPAETISQFVDSDEKKRTPTYLACSYWAPIFQFEASTLNTKFTRSKSKNKRSVRS